MGVRLFAGVLGVKDEELMEMVMRSVSAKIADEVVRKLLSDEIGALPDSKSFQGVMDLVTGNKRCSMISLKAKVGRPIIGLGAPAKEFIAPLAELLGAHVIIPNDYEVGNAIGAACGQVSEFVDVFVYHREKGYAVFSSYNAPIPCGGEDEAVKKARELATKYALDRARAAGGSISHGPKDRGGGGGALTVRCRTTNLSRCGCEHGGGQGPGDLDVCGRLFHHLVGEGCCMAGPPSVLDRPVYDKIAAGHYRHYRRGRVHVLVYLSLFIL